MKDKFLIIVALLMICFISYSFTDFVFAETKETWYVEIIEGEVLKLQPTPSMPEIKLLIPYESKLVKITDFKKIDESSSLINYINNNEGQIKNIAIRSDVFENYLKDVFNENIKNSFATTAKDYYKIMSSFKTNYDLITSHLENKNISFSSAKNLQSFIKIKIEPKSNAVFSQINFNQIVLNGSLVSENYLLKGNDTIELIENETKNYQDEIKEINISLNSKGVDFYLNSFSFFHNEKIQLPFKNIKNSFFELKNNVIVRAQIQTNLQNSYSSETYYYLPPGFVIFPKEGEISLEYYSYNSSTKEAAGLNKNEYKIRNKKGYVVFIPKEALFEETTIKTTLNTIEEIYMSDNSNLYYKYNDELNIISSEKKPVTFINKRKRADTNFLSFDDYWNFNLTHMIKESFEFKYNGLNIVIKENVGPLNTKLIFTPLKKDSKNFQIIGKAAYKETYWNNGLIKIEFYPGTNLGDYKEINISYKPNYINEERILNLIEKAKEFEKGLKNEKIELPLREEIVITTIEKEKGPRLINSIEEKCKKLNPSYSCITFKQNIYQTSFEENGLHYSCIITPSCENNWCCSGGANRRCCSVEMSDFSLSLITPLESAIALPDDTHVYVHLPQLQQIAALYNPKKENFVIADDCKENEKCKTKVENLQKNLNTNVVKELNELNKQQTKLQNNYPLPINIPPIKSLQSLQQQPNLIYLISSYQFANGDVSLVATPEGSKIIQTIPSNNKNFVFIDSVLKGIYDKPITTTAKTTNIESTANTYLDTIKDRSKVKKYGNNLLLNLGGMLLTLVPSTAPPDDLKVYKGDKIVGRATIENDTLTLKINDKTVFSQQQREALNKVKVKMPLLSETGGSFQVNLH